MVSHMMVTASKASHSPCLKATGSTTRDQINPNRVPQRVEGAARERIYDHAALKPIKSKTAKIVLSLEQRALGAILKKDSLAAVDALIEEISWNELVSASKKKHPGFSSLRSMAAALAETASSIPDPAFENTPLSTLLSLCKCAIRKILHLLDTILSSLGMEDLFSHADNEFQASHKLQKIILLISILTSLLTLFAVSSITLETALIISGSILVAASLSAFYIRYLKPAPSNLPCARNLTEEATRGNAKPIRRRPFLDLLAAHLEQEGELKRHLLLIGPRDVGKTKLIEDLSKAICHGVYPKLKGKQIFYFNTADLIATSYSGGIWGDGDRILQKIVDAIGRHREDIIIVFDDIHTACKQGENYYFADRLKAYLDSREKGFIHFIAIASTEDYNQLIFPNDPGFEVRFHKMRLESAGGEETVACLRDKMASLPNIPLMEEGALEFLFEKVRESSLLSKRPEPLSSLLILDNCLKVLDQSWQPSKQDVKLRLQEEKRNLVKAHSLNNGRELLLAAALKKWETIETALQEIESIVEKERSGLNKLRQLKNKHEEASKNLFDLASRVSVIDKGPLSKEELADSKKFLFLIGFYLPMLEKKLEKTALSVDAKIKLTKDLILREINKEEEAIRDCPQTEIV